MADQPSPLAGKPRSEGKSDLLWTRLKVEELKVLDQKRQQVEARIGRSLSKAELLRGIVRWWMAHGKAHISRTDP